MFAKDITSAVPVALMDYLAEKNSGTMKIFQFSNVKFSRFAERDIALNPSGSSFIIYYFISFEAVVVLMKNTASKSIPGYTGTGLGWGAVQFELGRKQEKVYTAFRPYLPPCLQQLRPRRYRPLCQNAFRILDGTAPGRRCYVYGIVTNSSFKACGGHLLSATVSTGSLEITVVIYKKTEIENG